MGESGETGKAEEWSKTGKVYKIDDIARELGVSKTTVSRAISGKGRISRATTQRVWEFIEKHDYRPNIMARGLAKSKTYNIGMLFPMEYGATEFAFFKDCMNGVCEAAAELDYDVLIGMVEGADLSRIQRLVTNKKVDGIILTRALVHSGAQEYLKEKGVPFLVIGPCTDPEVVSVDNKNLEGSRELTSILLLKGNRKIALIGGDENHRVTESRYRGYLEAHQTAGISPDAHLVTLGADTYPEIAGAVKHALEAGADGILCMDDFICGQVLGCLAEKGIRIPAEIRIASLYDSSELEHRLPSVTAVHFDTRELGRNACRRLLRLLGEHLEELGTVPGYQVILRESTQ